MANPCEQYCANVVAALRHDYGDRPEHNGLPPDVFSVRDDLGPARMMIGDLSITVSADAWRTWSDGRYEYNEEQNSVFVGIRADVTFSMLCIYHAVSADEHGEGFWNAHGLVAGFSSWLTWRNIHDPEAGPQSGLSTLITRQVETRPSYNRQGAWEGWIISWSDEILLPARFEYHAPDALLTIGPEEPDMAGIMVDAQMFDLLPAPDPLSGYIAPSDSPEFAEVDGGD